jgi:hypothetical protein
MFGVANDGIVATTGSIVLQNTVHSTLGFGLHLDGNTGYGNNVLTSTGRGNVVHGVQIAPNVCGTATCP